MMRIGMGYDVHAFGAGDHVMLGSIRIAHPRGVIAHSDGDVLLHALCDALLGAAGLGDIGQHFRNDDPRYRGIASSQLVAECMTRIGALGFRVVNADLTLLAEQPRLGGVRTQICAAVAALLGCEAVNVKATTTEGLGAIGHGDGLAAYAVVLLESST